VIARETAWNFVLLKNQREVSTNGSFFAGHEVRAKSIDLHIVLGHMRL